jgi:dTMP kinase
MENKKGMFVVFEGIDNAGTSTQLIELVKHIENKDKYQDVYRTHEPWKDLELKKRLEKEKDAYSNPNKMAELFVGSRIRHSEYIRKRLEEGVFVICDRYKPSTCAYQWTQGVELYKLLKMHEGVGILTPEVTFFVDTPLAEAQRRREETGLEREKFEEWNFQKELLAHYKSLFTRKDAIDLFGNVETINGSGSINEVANRISKKFDRFYSEWQKS